MNQYFFDPDPFSLQSFGQQGRQAYLSYLEFLSEQSIQLPIFKLPFIKDPDGIKNQGNYGTCYAHATVTCIRCAEIRNGMKYPQNADKIYLKQIVDKFGCNGAQLYDVLPWILPKVNLKYKKIQSSLPTYQKQSKQKIQLMKKYVSNGIPVLIVVEWTDQGLDGSKKKVNLKKSTHAMVIVGIEEEYWKVQNSWGEEAHDKGIVQMHKDSYIREAYIIYSGKEKI